MDIIFIISLSRKETVNMNICVTNKHLSKEDFSKAYTALCHLELCVLDQEKGTILFHGKSEKKQQFSVDCGRMTTELNAFILAIRHYLGAYGNGVEIKAY